MDNNNNSQLLTVNSQLPKGWEMKTLSDLTSKLGDGLHGTPKYTENGEYYFINGNNLNRGEIVYKGKTKRVSKVEFEKYKKPLNDRTVFVSINGTLGNVAFYNNEKIILGKSACYFNLLENIDKYYIKYLIQSPYFIEYAHKEATGATIKNVSLKTMRAFEVPFPKFLKEQQQIVAILDKAFTAIDQAKTNAQQNLLNAKELFESYLQNVFENKGDNWVEKTLGDENLLKIVDGDRGKNYPRKSDFQDDGYCLFMNTKNVRTDGFLFDTKMFITKEKDELMGKGKLTRNDVVMTTRGTIGNLGVYDENVPFENIRINSGMLIFRPNQEVLSSQYLFELFRSGIMKDLIKKYVSGAAQPQLPIKTLVNFSLPIPKSLKKQQQIVKKLNSLSAETKKLEIIYQQKIEALEELKKSVLQKAFSGQLKVENG